MRYFLSFCFAILMLSQSVLGYAAEAYDSEETVELKSYFRVQATDVHFTVLQGNAEIVLKDGAECLYFPQAGDVLAEADFLVPNFAERFKLRYLLHVRASDVQLKMESYAQKPADFASFPEQVLQLVNHERAKAGVSPLYLSPELQRAAMLRAVEITKFFSHTRPDGRDCNTVLSSPWGVGENISAGSNTAQEVVARWMNSPGHRRNILYARFKELGVGYCYAPDGVGGYVHYWVQIFRE